MCCTSSMLCRVCPTISGWSSGTGVGQGSDRDWTEGWIEVGQRVGQKLDKSWSIEVFDCQMNRRMQ